VAWVMGAHSVACTMCGSLGVASLDSQLAASVQAVQAGRFAVLQGHRASWQQLENVAYHGHYGHSCLSGWLWG
jgi:hypothetical protein